MNRLFNPDQENDFFVQFRKILRLTRDESKRKIMEAMQEIIDRLQAENLDRMEYFPSGTLLKYLQKMASGKWDDRPLPKTVTACRNEPAKWAKKKTEATERLVALAEAELCERLDHAETLREEEIKNYQSAQLLLVHLDQLRLLRAIEKAVDMRNGMMSRFQLSNTQTLLSKMIGGSDAPFHLREDWRTAPSYHDR